MVIFGNVTEEVISESIKNQDVPETPDSDFSKAGRLESALADTKPTASRRSQFNFTAFTIKQVVV